MSWQKRLYDSAMTDKVQKINGNAAGDAHRTYLAGQQALETGYRQHCSRHGHLTPHLRDSPFVRGTLVMFSGARLHKKLVREADT